MFQKPDSRYAAYDAENDSGIVTSPVSGSHMGGVRSPSTKLAASSFSDRRATSLSISRAVSASTSS